MTRVTFYIHEGASDVELWLCRLLDKIQRSGRCCSAWIPDDDSRLSLDRRLWTWSQGSFTAHELESATASAAPITLTANPPLGDMRETLLIWRHDGTEPPAFFSQYERCLEIVAGDDAERAPARARYRFYRDRGYPLETHNISVAG